MRPAVRVTAAAVVFLSWLGYLGYAAVTKSRAPVVSQVQAAAAEAAVVARWSGDGPQVTLVEQLWGPPVPGELQVVNLPAARGRNGPGDYLLFLASRGDAWEVVGPQRSPGLDLPGIGPPVVYPWSVDVQRQVEALRPGD